MSFNNHAIVIDLFVVSLVIEKKFFAISGILGLIIYDAHKLLGKLK